MFSFTDQHMTSYICICNIYDTRTDRQADKWCSQSKKCVLGKLKLCRTLILITQINWCAHVCVCILYCINTVNLRMYVYMSTCMHNCTALSVIQQKQKTQQKRRSKKYQLLRWLVLLISGSGGDALQAFYRFTDIFL